MKTNGLGQPFTAAEKAELQKLSDRAQASMAKYKEEKTTAELKATSRKRRLLRELELIENQLNACAERLHFEYVPEEDLPQLQETMHALRVDRDAAQFELALSREQQQQPAKERARKLQRRTSQHTRSGKTGLNPPPSNPISTMKELFLKSFETPNAYGVNRTIRLYQVGFAFRWTLTYPGNPEREHRYSETYFTSQAAARRSARRITKNLAQ